ncbi:MAG: T9SS type A sorting domain-containing protein, partial [Bacteroidota bacterium]
KSASLKSFLAKTIIVFVRLGLTKVNCYAVHKIAVMSGTWSNAFIWTPSGLPASNDSIIIAANVYYDIPITITAGGSVIINPGCSLCGQDSFKILCGGYLTLMSYSTMSGVYIGVTDGVIFSAGWVAAENAFVSNPCSTGFTNNGTLTIGLPFGCSPATGVEQINTYNDEVKVFPNPFTDHLEISSEKDDFIEIVLYDFISRKCLQKTLTNAISLNTGQLENGVYFYEMRNKEGVIQKRKVVKE